MDWINWTFAVIAALGAFFAWDVARVSKQTISNYLEVIEDLRNSLAAEEGVSDNLKRQLFELDCYVSAHAKAYPPKDYAVVDKLTAAAVTAFDKAKEGTDHTVIGNLTDPKLHIKPTQPWPRNKTNEDPGEG